MVEETRTVVYKGVKHAYLITGVLYLLRHVGRLLAGMLLRK